MSDEGPKQGTVLLPEFFAAPVDSSLLHADEHLGAPPGELDACALRGRLHLHGIRHSVHLLSLSILHLERAHLVEISRKRGLGNGNAILPQPLLQPTLRADPFLDEDLRNEGLPG